MDKAKLVVKLNEAIALELGALLQYNQYAQVLLGRERRVWQDFFSDSAEESFKHARKFGERVVALGGRPSVEPEPVHQTDDLIEMLENSLELERKAVRVYTEALAVAEDNPAYRNLLEDQIQDEQMDVEEIEMYLDRVKKLADQAAPARSKKTA